MMWSRVCTGHQMPTSTGTNANVQTHEQTGKRLIFIKDRMTALWQYCIVRDNNI